MLRYISAAHQLSVSPCLSRRKVTKNIQIDKIALRILYTPPTSQQFFVTLQFGKGDKKPT